MFGLVFVAHIRVTLIFDRQIQEDTVAGGGKPFNFVFVVFLSSQKQLTVESEHW